jgi:hypothetical protein
MSLEAREFPCALLSLVAPKRNSGNIALARQHKL